MSKILDDYGTRVKFRVRDKSHVDIRQFFGKSHAEEANKFVNENQKDWDFMRLAPLGFGERR
jgi:hypothetical protein